MNGQPTAQNTRETGADGDLPGHAQLGQPGPRRRARRALERRPAHHPALGAADPRHADLPLRRAGLDRAAVDLGDQPGGVAARAGPHPSHPRASPSCSSSCRTCSSPRPPSSPTSCCPPPPGARSSARSPTPTAPSTSPRRPSTRPARPAPTSTSSSTTPGRMDFRDRDGEPLITWHDAESAFEAWKACSAGRPCDYTGITYDRLRGGSGIQWPCTAERPTAPSGSTPTAASTPTPTTARPTATTSPPAPPAPRPSTAPRSPPGGRSCTPPTTSRRRRSPTTTTRSCSRPAAPSTTSTPAPRPAGRRSSTRPRRTSWVEISAQRRRPPRHRRRRPRRGRARPAARSRPAPASAAIRPGVVFVPFHYGYWDTGPGGREPTHAGRAANELTLTAWDPVSKQPMFKVAAVALTKIADGGGTRVAGADHRRTRTGRHGVRAAAGGRRRGACDVDAWSAGMNLAHYLGLLHRAADEPGRRVPRGRRRRTATSPTSSAPADASPRSATATPTRCEPFADRYGEDADDEPDRLHSELFKGSRDRRPRPAPRPARPLPDGRRVRHQLDPRRPSRQGPPRRRAHDVVDSCEGETATQLKWLRTRMNSAAPQALVVA